MPDRTAVPVDWTLRGCIEGGVVACVWRGVTVQDWPCLMRKDQQDLSGLTSTHQLCHVCMPADHHETNLVQLVNVEGRKEEKSLDNKKKEKKRKKKAIHCKMIWYTFALMLWHHWITTYHRVPPICSKLVLNLPVFGPQDRWSHVDLPTEQVESCWLAHRTGGVMLTCPQNRWSHVDLPTEQVGVMLTCLQNRWS